MEQAKQATILAVDDDEFNLKLLKKMLAVEGHAVRTAASGEEALAAVAEQLPDLILLDVMMPGIDGFEVMRRIKADPRSRSIPIILVTALEDRESRLKGLENGAEEFLSKPVNRAELQMRVKNLLKVKADYLSKPVSANVPQTSSPVPLDVNVLKALVGDDEAIIREFLHDFRTSAEKIASELRTACAAGQAMDAGEAAHKLKSSARSVGALALGELCFEMEKAGKAGDMKALAVLLLRFEQELASVEGFLEGY